MVQNGSSAPQNRSQQRTLAREARVEGTGLFTAARSALTFRPAPVNHGIVFRRADLPGSPAIPAKVENVDPSKPRRTAIKSGSAEIETVEHVLSALAGLGIDNAVVDVEGPEAPIGDGSALGFAQAIEAAGTVEQAAPIGVICPAQPVSVHEKDACITYYPPSSPDEGLELTYVLDFDGPSPIERQAFTCRIEPSDYLRSVAPARTFSTQEEAQRATAAGLFKHLTARDMLVIGPSGPIDNAYRFDAEPARHKLLDLLGDLSLAGGPIRGRIVAVRSGHALNHKMARALREAAPKPSAGAEPGGQAPAGPNIPAMTIRQILDLLPHRYPMVLVDRVISLGANGQGVGIKNVTINEPFFVGHYPNAPIMPGVLILEAMAQLAGLVLSNVLDHKGKVAVLMSADEVRWRRPVQPGDQLRIEATPNKATSRLADVSCRALVEGRVAAEARLKFLMVDPSQVGSTQTR